MCEVEEQLVKNIVPNPWRRYFARTIDIQIYSIFIRIIFYFAFEINLKVVGISVWAVTILSCVLMLLIEPLLLRYLGTTPGKFILGLRLRNKKGKKLSYFDGFIRTWMILKMGYGFSIPFYNLYRLYVSHKACSNNEVMDWDQDVSYELIDKKIIRGIGYVLCLSIVFTSTFFLQVRTSLPIYRGDITTTEYAINYGYFIDFFDFDYNSKLQPDGSWSEDETNLVIYLGGKPYVDQKFTNHNDHLRKVEITYESEEKLVFGISNQMFLAYLAFAGSDKSISFNELYDERVISQLEHWTESYELQIGNIKITNEVEVEGYEVTKDLLLGEEASQKKFLQIFSIEKVK